MGKWEMNIGNVIKNNSGGRVVIEENGVRYNKKVSVVRQIVDGIVKQVWNAYDPFIASGTYSWLKNVNTYYTFYTISSQKVNEAIANGYSKVRCTVNLSAWWFDSSNEEPIRFRANNSEFMNFTKPYQLPKTGTFNISADTSYQVKIGNQYGSASTPYAQLSYTLAFEK